MTMTKQSWSKQFLPGISPAPQAKELSFHFLFSGNKLLLKQVDDLITIPSSADFDLKQIKSLTRIYMGEAGKSPCFTGEIEQGLELSNGFILRGLRHLYELFNEDIFALAGFAFQLIHWNKTYRFCGQCGTLTNDKADERAKVCPKCGLTSFPRISPAIIVAIVKDNQLLLARGKNFSQDFYSLIAGFVEAGESLEACIEREVMEEVGLKIKNIKYFASQSWPFPNSLMLGFTAEYASGEIAVDQTEIVEASWFTINNLPNIPDKVSIARQLIDSVMDNLKRSSDNVSE